jgi:acyl-coenzyme A synthetase/AMP-(fatty) acid ligase
MASRLTGVLDTEGKTLWQLVVERALLTPDKQMARDEQGRTLTFGQYKDWCERVAAGLSQSGIGEGTNVSWILPSRFESLVLTGALSRLGAIQNPILPIYRHREVGFIAASRTAVFSSCRASFAASITRPWPRTSPPASITT